MTNLPQNGRPHSELDEDDLPEPTHRPPGDEDEGLGDCTPDQPDVARLADALRYELASWRDDLEGRQRSDYDESRAELIERLADEYDAVLEIAERYRPE